MPISSRFILDNRIAIDDDDVDEAIKKLTQQEKAIFIEADALQIEMGNIVAKETGSGAIMYDVAKSTQHKDRYSALGMALKYISELEDQRKRKCIQGVNTAIGFVVHF